MRGYERRREGELAGTTGSRMSAFPVDVASSITTEPREITPGQSSAIGTSGETAPRVTDTPSAEPASVPKPTPTHIESIPHPRDNDGVWLEYAGSRWYSDGPAAVSTAIDSSRSATIADSRCIATRLAAPRKSG